MGVSGFIHVLVMHIITHFFPIFWKISRSSDAEKRTGGEEEGQEAGAEGGVEVDEEAVGDQRCCDIKIKCFCFTLTVIFHVQVEVQVEFTYLSVDGAE